MAEFAPNFRSAVIVQSQSRNFAVSTLPEAFSEKPMYGVSAPACLESNNKVISFSSANKQQQRGQSSIEASDHPSIPFPESPLKGKKNYVGWTEYCVTRLEMFYPLASTHVTFSEDRLAIVLERLVESFSELSFQVEYNNKPIRAFCTTLEQVKISVQIWRDRKNASECILEILRVSGDGIACQRYTRYLLTQATEVDESIDVNTNEAISPPCDPIYWDNSEESATSSALNKMESLVQRVPATQQVPSPVEEGKGFKAPVDMSPPTETATAPYDAVCEALDVVKRLIHADRRDARILGLESLVMLTNANSSGRDTATIVSQCVLMGHSTATDAPSHFSASNRLVTGIGNPDLEFRRTEKWVLGLAMMGRWLDDEDSKILSNEEYSPTSAILDECTSRASYLAWTIIAQGVQWLTAAEVAIFIQEADRLSGQTFGFIEKLLSFLATAASSSTLQFASASGMHAAYLAAHILSVVCFQVPMLRPCVSIDLVRELGNGPSQQHAAFHRALVRLWNVLAV